jgi:hypothetical protein
VGIDIIAGKLIEIGCDIPGGISRINILNSDRLEKKVVDFIEQRVAAIHDGQGKDQPEYNL